MLVRSISGIKLEQPLSALLGSGAENTIISSQVLSAGMIPRAMNCQHIAAMGASEPVSCVDLEDIVLCKFSQTKHINKLWMVDVFHSPHC